MVVTVQPGNLSGSIMAPASKSSMQRACAAALVAKGLTVINNPGYSNDDMAALDIVRRLGGLIYQGETQVELRSKGVVPTDTWVNCGESGLSIRMFTPLVALAATEVTVTGSGSLVSRPMEFFDEILPLLGVSIQSNQGKLPLRVCGPMKPANITIDGSLSSQFLTGLLLAFSAADACDVSITVNNLKSKPYIDLTLDVMQRFGLKVPENRNYESFYFSNQVHTSSNTAQREYTVEGDWSGAAFLLVAGAIAGPITIKGLDLQSPQADKAILHALTSAGAGMSIESEQIEMRSVPMKAFHFDATECPDLFPPLVALASYCEGKTVIEGTSRLTHKESNRALTLQQEFGKLGVQIDLQDDLMIVHGGKGLSGGKVHSRHDHRIAMACAVAALKSQSAIEIEDAEAINKSYPDFYEHLKQLGAHIISK